MANSYSAPNFNIDTSTNVAGLTALKGSAPAAGDKVYIYNGATVTVESDIALLQFILGQTSAGAAGAGNRYGLLTFNSGVTVTFDGNATNTNSGIQSTPTSADASSKGCLITANNTVFTNSVGGNNTANRWTINQTYGGCRIVGGSISFTYSHSITTLIADSARTNYSPIVRGVTFVNQAAGARIAIGGTNVCNMYCDFRFNDVTATSGACALFYFSSPGAGNLAEGAVIDYAGTVRRGTQDVIFAAGAIGALFYIANDRITYADTRQTQIVPTTLAFTNPGTGGELHFTIANSASYAATDFIFVYNSSGDALVGVVRLSDYTAKGYGCISCLTDGTAYTLYAKATSDGFNFSDATANASAATPTAPASPAAVIGGHFNRRI